MRFIRRKTNGRVVAGPFVGMKHMWASAEEDYCTRMVGTYEMELRAIVEDLCGKPFGAVVNVGASEGFYAVGFALRLPKARVAAFETSAYRRELIRRTALMNGVADRIMIEGECDLPALSRCLPASGDDGGALVFMDVEGAEEDLLAPDDLPALRQTHIVVEAHDFARKGVSDAIRSRFRQTHKIQRVEMAKRVLADLPESVLRSVDWLFSERCIVAMIRESRPEEMGWFYLSPLAEQEKGST